MDDRPIWMRPVQYTDDRFQDAPAATPAGPPPRSKPPLAPHHDISQILGDEDRQAEQRAAFKASLQGFKSKDDEPLDYSRGPRDEEFGVDDDYGPEPADEVGEDGEEFA